VTNHGVRVLARVASISQISAFRVCASRVPHATSWAEQFLRYAPPPLAAKNSLPRLAADGSGQTWLAFRIAPISIAPLLPFATNCSKLLRMTELLPVHSELEQ